MAISKKGLRKINVEGKNYYWKFNEKVYIVGDGIAGSLLIVDIGWYDVWLYVNDKENRPPDFEPKSVTPKFVSESILFALTQGWDKGKMEIEFRNGNYKLKKQKHSKGDQ